MADVMGEVVWLPRQRNDFAGVNHPAGGAIGTGKRPEVIVEGAVLFDDEDDVLNPVEPAMMVVMGVRLTLQCLGENRSAQADEAQRAEPPGKSLHSSVR